MGTYLLTSSPHYFFLNCNFYIITFGDPTNLKNVLNFDDIKPLQLHRH